MNQKEKGELFRSLHVKGSPVILFNIWDAGSARTIEQVGAKAIATGSWSVAAANGFDDGEAIPLDLVLTNIKRIVDSVVVPVTLDFETGYATELKGLQDNIRNVIAAGAIGINFEDRIMGSDKDLQTIADQSARIKAIREAADETGVPLYINARTDVFLKTYPAKHDAAELEEALERAAAYAEAGASGLFAPGLRDPELIEKLCDRTELPVNILVLPDTPPTKAMAQLGVARISYGAAPYRQMAQALTEAARIAFGSA
jgi:2-methylisocitrate lyase-like PEP mutase family enzyme